MPIKKFMQNLVRPSAQEAELQTVSVALMGGSASGKTSFFQGIMESMVNKSVQLGGGDTLLIEPIKVSRGVSPAMESREVQEQVLISAPPEQTAQPGASIFSQMMSYASSYGAMPEYGGYAQTSDKNADPVAYRDIEAISDQDRLSESLKLADQLRKMFTINAADGFQAPTATVRYVEITFSVLMNDKPKCLLTITDYAGELLDNASAEFNSHMVDILSRYLKRCDALILLANARALNGLIETTYNAEQCMFKEQLTRQTLSADNVCAVIRSMRTKNMTLLLALTQTDSPQIDDRISRNSFTRAQRDLRTCIYEIAFSAAHARNWSYGSIPVTVVGRKRGGAPNVDDMNRILNDAVLRQENVDTSILFCLYNALMAQMMDMQKEKAELEKPLMILTPEQNNRLHQLRAQLRTMGELRAALSGRDGLFSAVFEPHFALEVASETGEVRVMRSAGAKR